MSFSRILAPRRRLAALLALVLLHTAAVATLAAPAQAATRAFTPARFSVNTTGDIAQVGNTLLTCPAADPNCAAARLGDDSGGAQLSNNYAMEYVDVDGDAATFNSSSADLDLPAGSTVLWAGLYWGANSVNGARDQVRLDTPETSTPPVAVVDPDGVDDLTGPYQGVAVVTDLVVAGGNGTYTVANVQADTGNNRHAGWALLVAYRDTAQRTRNLTVFDGFESVGSGPVTVNVSGFETPPVGTVTTRLGAVTYEGDRGITGDQFLLNSIVLSDATNPADNPFNSSITELGVDVTAKNPNYVNQLGIDIDRLELVNVLANSATGAAITFDSTGDVYYPGALTVATDLYSPNLVLDKQQVDANGGDLRQGDRIDYTIGVVNEGDDAGIDSVLFDPIPEGTTYVDGSLTRDGAPVTDASDLDDAEFDAGATTARFALGDVAVGETTTVGLSVTVNEGVADGAAITNEATASYESTSGLVLSGSSNVVANAAAVASDLSVTATASPALLQVGQQLSVAVTVQNNGPDASGATQAVVTFPDGVAVDSWDVGLPCTPSGPVLTCDLGTLTNGEAVEFTVLATPSNEFADATLPVTVVAEGASEELVTEDNGVSLSADINFPPSVSLDAGYLVAPAGSVTLPTPTDPEGDAVTVDFTDLPEGGSVVANADGSVTFTADPAFKGFARVAYTLTDARGGVSAEVDTEFIVSNAAPSAGDDALVAPPGVDSTLDVLFNDDDANDDDLTITGVTQPAAGTGTVAIAEDGLSVVYTPPPGFSGAVTFTYTVSDGDEGGETTATVTLLVAATPIPGPDSVTTAGATPVSVDVLANDTVAGGGALTVTAVGVPARGTATIGQDGRTITYTPDAGVVGPVVLTYTVTSAAGMTATGTLVVTVDNQAPVAAADSAASSGRTIGIDVLANDTDANDDALRVVALGEPANGRVALNGNGTVRYAPDAGFSGTDTFTYTVADGRGGTVTGTVTVTVTADAAPGPQDDEFTTGPGEVLAVDVLANDGDGLTVTGVTQPATGGAVTLAGGVVTFTPETGFEGEVTFTYTVSDGDGGTAAATVTVTVVPPPARPGGYEVGRVAGATRTQTAVEVSQLAFPSADTVVLARSDVYADALAGAPVAAQRSAPILLTAPDQLSAEVLPEVRRLGATRVLILGGTSAVQPAVEATLRAEGLTVERVGGTDRFDTAALLADALGTDGEAFVVEGANADPARGWPDALSASYVAAYLGHPILLVTSDGIPEATRAALERHDVEQAVVVGGSAAVSEGVVAELEGAGFDPRRVAGADRYETSARVYAEAREAGMDRSVAWLATGRNWPDALTAGAAVGFLGETMLLVDGADAAGSAATVDVLRANRDVITEVELLGGNAAIGTLADTEIGLALQQPVRPRG